MSAPDSYYDTLELKPGASRQDVKRAFRSLAKIYHPDLYPYDEVARKSCERKMREINEAYEYLRRRAPDKPESAEAPPPEPNDPEPDLEAKYGAHTADEPWPEPEPFEENEPGITNYNEALAREAQKCRPSSWSPLRHRMPVEEPDFAGLFQAASSFAAMVAVLMTIFFIDATTVNVYFGAMRVVVCLGCLHGVYYSFCRGYWEISMACAVLAAVLNPAVPLRMRLEGWWIFNPLCSLILVFFWFVMLNRESDKALGIKRRE